MAELESQRGKRERLFTCGFSPQMALGPATQPGQGFAWGQETQSEYVNGREQLLNNLDILSLPSGRKWTNMDVGHRKL